MKIETFQKSSDGGWDPTWEENIYSKGRQLNLYPYHAVVSFVFANYGNVTNRSAITILELGCGVGNNVWFVAREGFTVAGIDGSPTAIKHAQHRLDLEGLKADLRVGDYVALPWKDCTFDMVLDRVSLGHATKRVFLEQALDESRRVLKPGGRLLSMIHSDEHPARVDAHRLPDGVYEGITEGQFADLGTVNFLTRKDVDTLYGTRLKITRLTHIREDDALGQNRAINAFWRIECVKETR